MITIFKNCNGADLNDLEWNETLIKIRLLCRMKIVLSMNFQNSFNEHYSTLLH